MGPQSMPRSQLPAMAMQNEGEDGRLLPDTSPPPAKKEVDPGAVEGTDLRIVRYPHPSLRAPNEDFSFPGDQEEVTKVAKEMFKVMYAAGGVGLAAPQVGVNKRLMVYNPTGDSKKWLEEKILVNPQIV